MIVAGHKKSMTATAPCRITTFDELIQRLREFEQSDPAIRTVPFIVEERDGNIFHWILHTHVRKILLEAAENGVFGLGDLAGKIMDFSTLDQAFIYLRTHTGHDLLAPDPANGAIDRLVAALEAMRKRSRRRDYEAEPTTKAEVDARIEKLIRDDFGGWDKLPALATRCRRNEAGAINKIQRNFGVLPLARRFKVASPATIYSTAAYKKLRGMFACLGRPGRRKSGSAVRVRMIRSSRDAIEAGHEAAATVLLAQKGYDRNANRIR